MKNGGRGESKEKWRLGKRENMSSHHVPRGTYKVAVLLECWPETNRVIEMKAETDVGKSRWPAKWKIMFYTDAETNRVNKNLKDTVISICQVSSNEKSTPFKGNPLKLSSKIWHIEFYFHSKLSSASFAKHYGTNILTDCKCFCGKFFHGSHQLNSAGLLLLQ